MFGILNLHKPAGWTSRDVVNRVQSLVRPAKVGHAGTLDPLATGVLVVAVGPATRLISYVQQMPKEYRATFLLGRTSPSEDTESELTELQTANVPTLADIETCLPKFVGNIRQRPPAYSALKVQGRRAYQLARQGYEVKLAPRTIQIFALAINRYVYPELDLAIRCGSGTYVRSLGRDLAESLSTGAVMSKLTRTAIGPYLDVDAVDVEQLQSGSLEEQLLAPLTAVSHLPQAILSAAQASEIRHGRVVAISDVKDLQDAQAEVVAATNPEGRLVALLRRRQAGTLGPLCNFVSPA